MSLKVKRILIVDDEEDLTWSISRNLSKDNQNYQVLCVNSGSSALEMLKNNQIDLLVTDLRMPGIDGYHLVKEVAANYPNTKVIVMTAYGSVEIRESLHKDNRADYIEKPFEMNELRRLIALHFSNQSHQHDAFDCNISDTAS